MVNISNSATAIIQNKQDMIFFARANIKKRTRHDLFNRTKFLDNKKTLDLEF